MNAEALSGTVLGTCTLQNLIGRGGMGAVFLAQQSRPRRQVAVKVLFPMTPLQPHQRAAFLERFRRETDAAASLEHPNILPVHEYGERDGMAYLVMPYINGGTLRDELEREGQLPWSRIINYLEQMATALDFAHERGVIHRDVKPANILMTKEKRLLLTDFGLVKVVTEGRGPQSPLSQIGMPLGTPDYMAPEQVVGGEIDGRADLYALGVILYQMVTGSVPFKGDMPMKVALQHMHTPPPSPRTLRTDLPAAAEQVILRALAKRPADRYMQARDLASAFRLALDSAGVGTANMIQPVASAGEQGTRRRGLFDPKWRENVANPAAAAEEPPTDKLQLGSTMAAQFSAQTGERGKRNDIVGQTSMTIPSFSGIMTNVELPVPTIQQAHPSMGSSAEAPAAPATGFTPLPATRLRPGHKTSLRNLQPNASSAAAAPTRSNTGTLQPPQEPSPGTAAANVTRQLGPFAPAFSNGQAAGTTRQLEPVPGMNGGQTGNATRQLEPLPGMTGMLPGTEPQPGATGALQLPTGEYNGETGMLKLAQPVRVVKVPVAGQPGQYMTGILPMQPTTPEPETPASLPEKMKQNKMKTALVLAAFLILFGALAVWLTHLPGGQQLVQQVNHSGKPQPNMTATAVVRATATAQANIILTDTLSSNFHNWPVSTSGSQISVFKDGSYHITANDDTKLADALLADFTAPDKFVYTITMDEIKGKDDDPENYFGLILRYNSTQKNGQTFNSFYSLQVLHNTQGAQYELIKYHDELDDSGNVTGQRDTIWHKDVGKEYHLGQGPKNKNTISVALSGDAFTIIVNGTKIDTAHNGDLHGGQIGMMVNLKGTEVAFSNLELTQQ